MFKTILTHMTGTGSDQPTLTTALQAAQMDLVTSMMLADALTVVEQQNREGTQRARVTLAEFCKREDIVFTDKPLGSHGVTAHWREKIGDEFDELTSQARFQDLVVMAGGAERKGRLAPEGIGQIIVGS